MLKQVLPKEAFGGRGVNQGPMQMIHLQKGMHFIQCGLLHDFSFVYFIFYKQNGHGYMMAKITLLIKIAQSSLPKQKLMLVYADTEDQLLRFYNQFQHCKKYPHYLSFIKSQWDRRKEWAICCQKQLFVRGNQTNNYAEAGIRILKDLVFSRVKAYNLVQRFGFVTECMELYYIRKILSVAHNRFDRHISLIFQGLKCAGISHLKFRS